MPETLRCFHAALGCGRVSCGFATVTAALASSSRSALLADFRGLTLGLGVGMWWIAAFLHSSMGGDLIAPVEDGRWVGAPMIVLLALFTFVGLAAVGGAIFLIRPLVSTTWQARRPRR